MEKSRIEKLLSKINDDEGILITDENNCFYFSSIRSSNITLYITKTKRFLITDFRYAEIASTNKGSFHVLWEKNLFDNLKDIITEKKVYIETDTMTYDMYSRLTQLLNTRFFKMGNLIRSLRLIKDEEEINLISKAQAIADKAFENILDCVKPGITEIQLKTELEYQMAKLGSQKPSFDTIVLFNKSTSLPHGEPSDNILKPNSIILIDFGATYKGYCSDTTRTFFYKNPSERILKTYKYVLNAHKIAKDNICEDMPAYDADALARNYLNEKGIGKLFGHSLGHGVGLNIHEAPVLSPKGSEILKNNMTFSIEPGVYFENDFGIRIEDLYYMRDSHPCSFTKLPKKAFII